MTVTKEELISLISRGKTSLLKKYPIRKIGLFGSWVRNQQKKNSDVDTLIELSEPVSLFDFIDIQDTLENLLGRKVDLVTLNALKPEIRNRVLAEVEFI